MPSTYSVSELLNAFDGVHDYVDVRLAAVRDTDHWLLVALSVHVRSGSKNEAIREFKAIREKFGTIDSEHFRIVQFCRPPSELGKIQKMLQRRRLKIRGVTTIAQEGTNLSARLLSLPWQFTVEIGKWPVAETYLTVTQDPIVHRVFHNDVRVQKATELTGYGPPHAAVRKMLGINFEQNSVLSAIWLRINIPIALAAVSAQKVEDGIRLQLEVQADRRLHDLAAVIRRLDSDEKNLIERHVVALTRHESRPTPRAALSGAVTMPLERNDTVWLDIGTRNAGIILSRRIDAYDLLPPEHANPLYAALTIFCSPDELRVLLTQPEAISRDGKISVNKPEKLFEISVQWLLTLLGFKAIWMHLYETHTNGPVNRGSADCLAYSGREDLLLVVNCSLKPPDTKELQSYAELCARISTLRFTNAGTAVKAIVFVGTRSPTASTNEQNEYGVRVVYREEIERLLSRAQGGHDLLYSRFEHPLFGAIFSD